MRSTRFISFYPLLSLMLLSGCFSGDDPISVSTGARAEHTPSSGSIVMHEASPRDPGSTTAAHAKRPARADPELPPQSVTGFLRTEESFVDHDGISTSMAMQILSSGDKLAKAIERMTADASGSMEAQDLSRHYRSALARAVGDKGDIASFACGLSICAGSVRTRTPEEGDAWRYRFLDDSAARTYGNVSDVEDLGGVYETRFMFSTDPAVPALTIE